MERAVHWRVDAHVHLGGRKDGSCALTRAGRGDGHRRLQLGPFNCQGPLKQLLEGAY